jgi:hypothetical protein
MSSDILTSIDASADALEEASEEISIAWLDSSTDNLVSNELSDANLVDASEEMSCDILTSIEMMLQKKQQ